jgi:hypothetical protein
LCPCLCIQISSLLLLIIKTGSCELGGNLHLKRHYKISPMMPVLLFKIERAVCNLDTSLNQFDDRCLILGLPDEQSKSVILLQAKHLRVRDDLLTVARREGDLSDLTRFRGCDMMRKRRGKVELLEGARGQDRRLSREG